MTLPKALFIDRPLPRRICLLASLIIIAENCLLAVPWLFGETIDCIIAGTAFWTPFIILSVVAACGVFFEQLVIFFSAVIARSWKEKLRQQLLDAWCAQQPDTAEQWPQGEGGMKFLRDIPILGDALQNALPQLLRALIMFLLTLSFAFWQCWRIGVILLISMPLLLAMHLCFQKRFRHIAHQIRLTQDDLCSRLFEFLNAYPELKAQEADSSYHGRVAAKLDEITSVEYDNSMMHAGFQRSVAVLLFFCEYATLATACLLASHGHLLIGQIVFFQIMVMRVLNCGVGVLQLLPQLVVVREAIDSLSMLIMSERPLPASTALPMVNANSSFLELFNISFAYPGSPRQILENYSMRITRGETIFLGGCNGIGKTTLWKIMTGWLTPTGGGVFINGHPISENLRDFREKIAFVTQRTVLFYGSLLENITLNAAEARENDLAFALHFSGFGMVVARFPEGLDKRLESNAGLSGGECQRLALARALYRKPELLVLDEVTNHMDSSGKEIVESLIQSMHGRITMLVISHDEAIRALCDREIIMQ